MGQGFFVGLQLSVFKESSFKVDYGEIVEIPEELGRLRVDWKIPDFMSLESEKHTVFFSPKFSFLQEEFCLGILLSGEDPDIRFHIFLRDLEQPVRCAVGIRQVDGTVDRSCNSNDDSFTKNDLLEKQSKWLSSGVLIVTLEMQRAEASEETPEKKHPEVEVLWDSRKGKAKEPELICLSDDSDAEGDTETSRLQVVSQGSQTEDFLSNDKEITEHEQLEAKSISKLTKHLEDLLLELRDHDITIKVKNHTFKAHKAVLQARSPVFLSMFEHDMEESASGVISIDDCDPGVFGQFLRHIYTGKFEMDSAKSAIALHYAADKYDFQELKEACVRYLCNSFSTDTVFDVIKMAAVHSEKQLLQRASMFFERNLEEIMTTVEWQIFLRNNSTMANELILQAVSSRSERPEQKEITVCVECPSCSVKRK